MSRRFISRTLKSIAYGWMSFPIAYLFYGVIVLALNTAGLVKLVLSPWYWIVSAVAALAGYGLLRIRWYGWYSFVLSNLMIAYQTAITLANDSVGDWNLLRFFGTIVGQLVVIFLVAREIRVPYFFPKIRWWESDPRYKLSVQVKLVRGDGSELEGEIMDLSMGGCFVKSHSHFIPEEVVQLSFSLFEKHLECSGFVVWRTESTVTHPKGVGVKFNELPKETQLVLKQATLKLRKLARVYNQMSRERNWQEYLQREQRYQGRKRS